MHSKVEFTLKPITGSAQGKGGFRAELETGKGEVVGLDGVIAEAIEYGYVTGIKPAALRGVILGLLKSMIDRVMDDGRPRRIDDYFLLSMKVHGSFESATDEFDPARHRLGLTLRQLNAYHPSFRDVQATNVNHKRQFRIYSIRSIGDDGKEGENGRLELGRDFAINGGDVNLSGNVCGDVHMYVRTDRTSLVTAKPRIISSTDAKIRCAWPEDLLDGKYRNKRCQISVGKLLDPSDRSSYKSQNKFTVIV